MNRRAFITGLGAVLAAPLAAEAEQVGKVPRIGLLSPPDPLTASMSSSTDYGIWATRRATVSGSSTDRRGARRSISRTGGPSRCSRGSRGDDGHPHRHGSQRRSGSERPRQEPRSAGRQHDRRGDVNLRPGAEASGGVQGGRPEPQRSRRSCEPRLSRSPRRFDSDGGRRSSHAGSEDSFIRGASAG
jgi:hypothetical protein